VYEIALTVAACLRAGTRVDVAWVVEAQGFGSQDKAEALAITPGGGRVGSVLAGALNDQLVDVSERSSGGRIVDLTVGDLDAELAGLTCGGSARCLLVPATDLPGELWDRLRDRDPVCLVARLDGDRVADVALYGPENIADAGEDAARMFGAGVSDTSIGPHTRADVRARDERGGGDAGDVVVTVYWPVPKLVIVGAGAVADALRSAAELLGWHTDVVTEKARATGVIAGLAVLDKLVVTSHDTELAGPALAAALNSPVGYIGGLGSRRTQQARADWLAYRGITDLDRVHGPAGLDIGANTAPEIAVSILAEALAVASKRKVSSLREKTGSIH
jgi:xanthine dehydrogenase accessory factor